MKALLQRVVRAEVRVDGRVVGAIGRGLLVYVGVERGDTDRDAARLADRAADMRIFADADGKMNLGVAEVGGEILVVSQFTLAGSTRRGRRPSFDRAAPPDEARERVRRFVATLTERRLAVATGVFQAMMEVESINDGPVTFLVETEPDAGRT